MKISALEPINGHESLHFCEDDKSGLRAFISIHSTKHGPAAGGCRLWNYPTLEEAKIDVQRLSRGMTYKNRAADLPLGGGKAVIMGKTKSPELMRAFGRFVQLLEGHYYTAEDVGISPNDMEIVAQETLFVAGLKNGEHASGDPSPVTARGVYLCMKHAVEYKLGKSDLDGISVAIQGLGHVGWNLASLLHERGVKLHVTDLDAQKMEEAVQKFEAIAVGLDDIYDAEVDVFSPCALGATLNSSTVPRLRASVVAGAANNQLSEFSVGDLLVKNDIFYAPDYVVNAGGIINVATEILQCNDMEFAESRLKNLTQTLDRIIEISEAENIGMHSAADKYVEAQFY